MKLQSKRVRLLAVVATLITLVIYNLSGRSIKTSLQSEFESWLVRADEKLRKAEADLQGLPLITLDIASKDSLQVNWRLNASSDPEANEHVLRILHLIDDANILSFSPGKRNRAEPLIILAVKDGEHEFKAEFTESDINSNSKAFLMLRLMKEYSNSAFAGPDSSMTNRWSANNDRS